jgi:serine/threonine-protein kinase
VNAALPRLNAALSGRYRVERQLGEGGMATVYLAEDLKHRRRVALKVLKPELAAVVGAGRFLAEIETTANLQHPHILPLFDSGEADGFLFYVMPHVEGESLRERLDREHQLPVDEAVRIATNVAEALEYAHTHGVIHRDIKPANILLQSGKPVIADFGIALAVSHGGGGRLTETGLSLGTPHYMSPEQATGDHTVGPATDIWALGCVLYEMLVGEPPYTGSTPQAVLGKIITAEAASATEARRSVAPNVDAAIRKALEKVPADRFRSAEEFARALGEPGFAHYMRHVASVTSGRGRWDRAWVGAGAGALISLALVGAFAALRPPTTTESEVVRFVVSVDDSANAYLGGAQDTSGDRPTSTALALSPDGELLVYAASIRDEAGERSQLYIRPLNRERAAPIGGTENGSAPFFSDDGEWIAFFAGQALKRVRASGGEVETMVPAAQLGDAGVGLGDRGAWGAVWGADGAIYYGGLRGLYRVAAGASSPELILEADTASGFRAFAQPFLLPGGTVLLLHAWRTLDPETAEILALDLDSRELTTVLVNGMDPRYVETGHLLFTRVGTMMAVGFDADRVAVLGEPVVLLEDVMHSVFAGNDHWSTGASQFAISRVGHAAYIRGGVFPRQQTVLMSVALDGQATPIGMPEATYFQVAVSPEGDRIAFDTDGGLFVRDLSTLGTRRLETSRIHGFAWSPDGRSIAFGSDRRGVLNAYRMRVDATEEPRALGPSRREQVVSAWSTTGVIAYLEDGDIWVAPSEGSPAPFFTSPGAVEVHASFSPDGRWLAYASDETDRYEVYVRPYPGPGVATAISANGGFGPLWSLDGNQIYYYQTRPGQLPFMLSVDVERGASFRVGPAVPIVDPWVYGRGAAVVPWDLLPGGSLIARMNSSTSRANTRGTAEEGAGTQGVTRFTVILNFLEELLERVPN